MKLDDLEKGFLSLVKNYIDDRIIEYSKYFIITIQLYYESRTYTIPLIARLLKVTRQTVDSWCGRDKNNLPFYQPGGAGTRKIIRGNDLWVWLRQYRVDLHEEVENLLEVEGKTHARRTKER